VAALLIAAVGWPAAASATSRAAPEADSEAKTEPETSVPGTDAAPGSTDAPEPAPAKPASTPVTVEPTPRALAPSDLQYDRAKVHWEEGKRLYDHGRYAEAAVEFERSYAAVPIAVTLYSVGLSYERAGKPVEAVRAFRRFLALPDDCAALPPGEPRDLCTEQRTEAEQALDELRPRVGELALALGEGVKLREVRVAGRTVPLDDFPLLLLPGTVDVEVFGLGPNERRTRPVAITGGDVATFYVAPFERELVVTPPKPDPAPGDAVDELRLERRRRGLRTAFWVGTGLTASSGVAVAVLGGLTLYHRNEFRRDLCAVTCDDPDAPPYPEDHELAFERYKPLTNALVGVTVGLAVATALVGTFAFRKRPSDGRTGAQARVRMGASGLVVRW
jgi:hypothetical protein